MEKVYLFLARRDKKGLKVLSILNGPEYRATRINDLSILKLPIALHDKINNEVYQNRMLWELWAESAENFGELKEKLQTRGYTSLPLCCSPMFEHEKEAIVAKLTHKTTVVLPQVEQRKTMVRKTKS